MPDGPSAPLLGRVLITAGVLLAVTGLVVLGLGRLNLPLGRLPGDLNLRGRGWSFSSPVVTCLLLSGVLSLLLWLFGRLRR